ncbi:MAG: 6-carboxytetrahydropterin synthase QueD [bacterium]|nr:6-carboxytetrahydropterin synthase QueD [bacterium]
MFILKVIKTFSAAHNLRDYKGKCETLHGHNWKVEVEVQGKKLGKSGMLIDFHDLKRIVTEELAFLDHTYLNEVSPFDKINPTSENLAEYLYHEMAADLAKQNAKILRVTVWESDTANASYQEK